MTPTSPEETLLSNHAAAHGQTSIDDPVGAAGSDAAPEPVHRTVIFATTTAANDIPVPPDFPAALLPLGTESFIERVFGELSDLGLRDIDLVISDQPEALRLILGGGERWGITLRWHLAKTSTTPYALLRHIASDAQRVLIGHADHWVSPAMLSSLQAHDGIAMDAGSGQWCGWACLTGDALTSVNGETDMTTLVSEISANSNLERPQAGSDDHTFAGDAAQLLAVQQKALNDDTASVPATWIRTEWGAMSPDACVSSKAFMQGPVLVGPAALFTQTHMWGPARCWPTM